jgi:hypothetical protein
MKSKLTLIIGIILLLSCSSRKYDTDNIEFLIYNYLWKDNTGIELRCYRYSIINSNGTVLYYRWKKFGTNEALYFKSVVEKRLIDSILIAAEKQKEQNKAQQGLISPYFGPAMKIKINQSNGRYEVIDFTMDDILSKYFDSIQKEVMLKPTYDTIELNNKKLELIKFIWKEDSISHKIVPPPPEDQIKQHLNNNKLHLL